MFCHLPTEMQIFVNFLMVKISLHFVKFIYTSRRSSVYLKYINIHRLNYMFFSFSTCSAAFLPDQSLFQVNEIIQSVIIHCNVSQGCPTLL